MYPVQLYGFSTLSCSEGSTLFKIVKDNIEVFFVTSCKLMIIPHMIRPSGVWVPFYRDIAQMTICSIALRHLFVDEDLDVVAFGSSSST